MLGSVPPLICDFVVLSDSDMTQRHFDITSHIHGCDECPDCGVRECLLGGPVGEQLYADNAKALTPTCPQWPWSKA